MCLAGSWRGAAAENIIPALIQAIRSNDLKRVEQEIARKADPNLAPGPSWDYPLIEACIHTNLATVNLLVEVGAKVDVTSGRKYYGLEGPAAVGISFTR